MTTREYRITREEVTRRLRAESEELRQRVGHFEARLREATEETRTVFDPIAERLRGNWQTLSSRLEQMEASTGETWDLLVRDVEGGLAQLASELAVATADLEAELAETRENYMEAVQRQLEAWRGRIERLRLQVALAEMEARDDLEDLLERADGAYRAARQHLEKAGDDTAETLEGLRAGARRVLADLAEAVEAAWHPLTAHRVC